MKLEEEIKSDKFESPQQKAILEILFTSSWLNNKHEQLLKPYGISTQQYNILRILRGAAPHAISMKEIKERAINKTPHLTRMTQKLLASGYISCTANKEDKRVTLNAITEEGLQLLNDLEDAMNQFNKIAAKLNRKEAQQLADLLEKLRN